MSDFTASDLDVLQEKRAVRLDVTDDDIGLLRLHIRRQRNRRNHYEMQNTSASSVEQDYGTTATTTILH